jgi:hypothetical protein
MKRSPAKLRPVAQHLAQPAEEVAAVALQLLHPRGQGGVELGAQVGDLGVALGGRGVQCAGQAGKLCPQLLDLPGQQGDLVARRVGQACLITLGRVALRGQAGEVGQPRLDGRAVGADGLVQRVPLGPQGSDLAFQPGLGGAGLGKLPTQGAELQPRRLGGAARGAFGTRPNFTLLHGLAFRQHLIQPRQGGRVLAALPLGGAQAAIGVVEAA